MQDFSFITTWIDNSLRSLMPGWLTVTVDGDGEPSGQE